MNFIQNILNELPFLLMSIPVVIFSLSFHEAAHAFAAQKLGDSTAANLGRLTLNPLKHLDPIGAICLALFRFGWAKPVPINSRNFRNPKRDMALSALAGPVSNLVLALVFGLLLKLFVWLYPTMFGENIFWEIWDALKQGDTLSPAVTLTSIVTYMLYNGVILNISLAVFNLIPITPLDGSRILYIFLPTKAYFGIMKYERYIGLAFMVILVLGVLDTPISFVVSNLSELLFKLYGVTAIELNTILTYLINGFSR